MDDRTGDRSSRIIDMTAELVSAYVSNNQVQAIELPPFIAATHAALAGLGWPGADAEPVAAKATPAQIRRSVTYEALVSFEDGKSYKTLRRHLRGHGLTPERYREKWGLPSDYPMSAASYSAQRSKLARALGLGRKAVADPAGAEPAEGVGPAAAPKRGGRRAAKVSADV